MDKNHEVYLDDIMDALTSGSSSFGWDKTPSSGVVVVYFSQFDKYFSYSEHLSSWNHLDGRMDTHCEVYSN